MIPRQHTLKTPYMVPEVHCYSTVINDELILFDCGPPTAETSICLQNQLPLERLRHVIMTHCHVEHYGQARWLQQETDATLYLPWCDHLRLQNHEANLEHIFVMLAENGFETEFIRRLELEMRTPNEIYAPVPENYRIVENDLPAHLGLSWISCPGHSPSDLVLIHDNWAIAGDILLRGIFQTPLLEWDFTCDRRFDNYAAYCNSLHSIAGLRGKIILPGHFSHIDSIDQTLLAYLGKLLRRASLLQDFAADTPIAVMLEQILGNNQKQAFITFAKASELIFLRDFLQRPQLLEESVRAIGLYPFLAEKFNQITQVQSDMAS